MKNLRLIITSLILASIFLPDLALADTATSTLTDSGYNNPHAASSINGTTNTYDNNGNLLSDGTWTHAWDYDNRVASSTNGSVVINYAYDHEGQRIKLSDGTTTTYYPDPYYSVSGATSTLQIFANGEHIATIEGNGTATSTYYIHTDHLGGTSAVSDESGAVVQNLDYFPFGGERLNEKAGGFDNERKFAGYIRDEDSGLDYVGARYYNSNVGKWISQDPITVRLNRNEVYSKLYENQYSKDPNFTTFLGAFRPQRGYRNTIKEEDLRDASFYYFLSDPQQLNSYNYVTNNPITSIDISGETEFHFSFTTNAGIGGSAGNTWSIGIATDGTYGISTSYHGGGMAGFDYSVGISAGYSKAESWKETEGKGHYIGGSAKAIGGVEANVNLTEGGEYEGVDVGIGAGYSSILNMQAGAEKTIVVADRNIKNDASKAWKSVKQGVFNTINKITNKKNEQ
ncbi:MAG: RHS repeat-associated core domain-containing protein [Patescibacteria group bacterium]|jgi:RHS repeat-associated protein